MRVTRSMSTVVTSAALVLAVQAFSQTTEMAKPAGMPHSMEMKAGAAQAKTGPDLLNDIKMQFDNVEKMIAEKKLAMVHTHAEEIGNDCKALATVDLPSDSTKRVKVEGYLKSMEKIAVKLDEYGDANNAESVTSEVKKGRALYDLLVKQYPQAAKPSVGAASSSGSSPKAAVTGYYTCTMHPEVHQAQPGNCPKCGMKLVYQKDAATSAK